MGSFMLWVGSKTFYVQPVFKYGAISDTSKTSQIQGSVTQ